MPKGLKFVKTESFVTSVQKLYVNVICLLKFKNRISYLLKISKLLFYSP